MMTAAQRILQDALAAGYRATVLHNLPLSEAFQIFNRAATNPAVMDAAKAELDRSSGIDPRRCHFSKIHAKFLNDAIAQFQPIAPPATKPQDHEMTSKLSTLADLAKSTIAQVEADAEAEVNKLLAAKSKANAAVASVGTIRTGIETGTKELEDFANQLTNGAPPLGS